MNRRYNISDIKNMAKTFRIAIESALDELVKIDSKFYRFPTGCCGDVSELLAQYFLINGIQSTYCFGTKYGETDFDKQSHAWLELNDGLIIDITADQFKGKHDYPQHCLFSCYVGYENELYNLFEVRPSCHYPFYGFDEYDIKEANRLQYLFEVISDYIR